MIKMTTKACSDQYSSSTLSSFAFLFSTMCATSSTQFTLPLLPSISEIDLCLDKSIPCFFLLGVPTTVFLLFLSLGASKTLLFWCLRSQLNDEGLVVGVPGCKLSMPGVERLSPARGGLFMIIPLLSLLEVMQLHTFHQK